MRLLFNMDKKDYDINGKAYVRPSARCIVIRDGKVAVVHSSKYDYYKFPGGGIEEGETPASAAIREAGEEAGLVIIPETMKEYGMVHRIEKYNKRGCDLLIQENYYYICDALPERVEPAYEENEIEEGFTFEFADSDYVIDVNRNRNHGPTDQNMLEREAAVLDFLKSEAYL